MENRSGPNFREQIKDMEFFRACEMHDWYYHMSDDHRSYSRGVAAQRELEIMSEGDPIRKKMFEDWSAYVFSGPTFGKEQRQRPKLTDYKR